MRPDVPGPPEPEDPTLYLEPEHALPATHDDRSYQRCTVCVMDTTDGHISFDGEGICDHCRTFQQDILPHWDPEQEDERAIETLVEKIGSAGRDKDFDCIIGMSGGADSSYLTYCAKERFGLRPLVFHVDAGWNTQIAVNNIERIIDGLELDLYTEVIDWAEMRDLQLAFFKSGVPHIDTPQDHAFFATMYKFAEAHRVQYILTGANYATECIRNPVEWMYHQSDSIQLRDIHRRFGTGPLRTFPLTTILRHKVYLPYVKRIKVVRPLNHVRYRKQEAVDFLQRRFGWQHYRQKHFESRFTRFYEGYWLPARFGYDTRKVQFSSLIVTGQMSRADALDELQRPPDADIDVAAEMRYVANKLAIPVDELRSYLALPHRTFRNYRSQHRLYRLGGWAMRKLRMEKGGKR